MDKLTTKQRLFVEAYLANPNATDAARKAGYKGNDNTLGVVGAENIRNPKISRLLENRVNKAIITADEILTDVKSIAKSAEKDSDRLKAYEMLGKHLAMWIDKTEMAATVKTLKAEELTDDELASIIENGQH